MAATARNRPLIAALAIAAAFLASLVFAVPASAESRRCYCRTHTPWFDGKRKAAQSKKEDTAILVAMVNACASKDKWYYIGDKGSQGDCSEDCKDADALGRDSQTGEGLWTNDPICGWELNKGWNVTVESTFCSQTDPNNVCVNPCYCFYPDNPHSEVDPYCTSLTTRIDDIPGGTEACQTACDRKGFVLWKSQPLYNEGCDFQTSDACFTPKNNNTSWWCRNDHITNCFCRYPDKYPNALCKGHSTWGGNVFSFTGASLVEQYGSAEDNCKVRCDRLGLEYDTVNQDYNARCDFGDDRATSDEKRGCKQPENYLAEICVKELGEQASRAAEEARGKLELEIAKRRGTAAALSLPLGTTTPQRIIGRIISAILGIVGGLALLAFVYGGIVWMTAAGNPDRVKQAKTTVVWAVIGLAGIFSAYALLNFILSAFAQ